MKILQVVQFFSPKHGGSAMVPYELSKLLQKAGHDVTVITTDFQIDNSFIDSLKGVEVIPFHCQMNIGSFLVSSSMKEYLKENINKFDIIHMHNFRTYQNYIVYKHAKKNNIPFILQAHGSVLPFLQKKTMKSFFDLFIGYQLLDQASKLIAVTKIEEKQYIQMGAYRTKIEIIPNGLNLNEYDNLPEKGEFRLKYSITGDEKIILYMGRIHKNKGLELLIKSFIKLKQKLDNARLVIVGPDNGFLSALKIQFKDSIFDKILFTGGLYDRDKVRAYVDADVCVLPSMYEIFGLTVIEANACGTPVVITNRCGLKDFVEDNSGYVVDFDTNELYNAIYKILTDENTRNRFRTQAKKSVREKFDWNKIIIDIEKIYECSKISCKK